MWKESRAGSIENIVELLGCLRSLVRASNGPLASKAQIVLSTTAQFLKISPTVTAGHHSAMQTINVVLSYITLNASALVSQFALEILCLVRTLWPRTKTEHLLADEMLISLSHLQGYFKELKDAASTEDCFADVEALLYALHSEYCSLREEKRGHLEHSDLGLHSISPPEFATNPMQLTTFHLRRCNAKSERNWAELHFIAFFTSWVDLHSAAVRHRQLEIQAQDQPVKRPRKMLKLDEIMEQISARATLPKIYFLQILCFMLEEYSLNNRQMADILEQLLGIVSHPNPELSTWALITIARWVISHCETRFLFDDDS